MLLAGALAFAVPASGRAEQQAQRPVVQADADADADKTLRQLRADALRKLDTPSMRRLAEWIGRRGAQAQDAQHRAAAAGVLAHLDDGEPPLLRLAQDDDPAVRRAALVALSQRALSDAARPVLQAALANGDAALAAVMLWQLGDSSGVPALRAALQAGRDPVDNTTALLAMGQRQAAIELAGALLLSIDTAGTGAAMAGVLAEPALTASLLQAYRAGTTAQRQQILLSIAALGRRAPTAARTLLYRAFFAPAPEVRLSATHAMLAFGDRSRRAQYRLIDAAFDDASAEVRAAAAAALVPVGGEAARDELIRIGRDRSAGVRGALCQALVQTPVHGTAALVARLRDEQAVARQCRDPHPPPPRPMGSGEEMLSTQDALRLVRASALWLAQTRDNERSAQASQRAAAGSQAQAQAESPRRL